MNWNFYNHALHKLLTNIITSCDILFDALNGAALSGRVKQQQQNGLQYSDHIIKGKCPNKPSLSCCAY